MHRQWEQVSTVKAGGRVEVVVPELRQGEVVKVSISSDEASAPAPRPLGLLRGKIRVLPNFDEPLEEFEL